jgi:hypothetical protein
MEQGHMRSLSSRASASQAAGLKPIPALKWIPGKHADRGAGVRRPGIQLLNQTRCFRRGSSDAAHLWQLLQRDQEVPLTATAGSFKVRAQGPGDSRIGTLTISRPREQAESGELHVGHTARFTPGDHRNSHFLAPYWSRPVRFNCGDSLRVTGTG